MTDVEKVARAIPDEAVEKALLVFYEGKLTVEEMWRINGEDLRPAMRAAIEAALAAMGERGPVADDRLAPVREDVIRMRLEALFAGKPIEQWGPMSLATALSPNVEFLVAAAVSNERLRAASPRPEAVGEAVPEEAEFELWQNGEFAAGSSGPRADAMREILHYAAAYGRDGPVEVQEVRRIPIDIAAAIRSGT